MAKRKVLRRRRVKLISTNRVDGDLTDIVFEEEVAVKARKRRVNHDVPDLIESRIVPGLFFNLFQGAIIFGSRIENPPDLVFRVLLLMEYYAGNATREEILGQCWPKEGSNAALRNAVSKANELLIRLGVREVLSRSKDAVVWE